jgi:hypothetical protein
LEHPQHNCISCGLAWKKKGKLPVCRSRVIECEIEEIMESPDSRGIKRRVDAFLLAEVFNESPGFVRTQEKLLSDAGVYDLDAEELAHMRIAVIKHNNREQRKRSGG